MTANNKLESYRKSEQAPDIITTIKYAKQPYQTLPAIEMSPGKKQYEQHGQNDEDAAQTKLSSGKSIHIAKQKIRANSSQVKQVRSSSAHSVNQIIERCMHARWTLTYSI